MRRIINTIPILIILLFVVSSCASATSKLDKEIERNILQRIAAVEGEKSIKIIWAGKLKMIREESRPYWTGRIVHLRAGLLPAEIKLKSGEIKKVEILFIAAYGEEDGKIVSGTCIIKCILPKDSPKYKENKNRFLKEVKTAQPWPRES